MEAEEIIDAEIFDALSKVDDLTGKLRKNTG